MSSLVVGGVIMAAAVLLAATSGFGLGLVATPLLLLCGLSLPFVITIVLLVAIATRVTVAWRLRRAVNRRRVMLLVGGAAPGLWIGSRTLGALDVHDVKIVVGVIISLAAIALAWVDRRPPRGPGRELDLLAGFLGGLLGTTTTLIGVPPALLLTRQRLAARSFISDLSVYFIATSALGLVVLAANGDFDSDALPVLVFWLPGAFVANAVGTTLGLRAREQMFRRLTLGLGLVAGVVTVVTA
jgi:uncharacterized membrane protein YfcA